MNELIVLTKYPVKEVTTMQNFNYMTPTRLTFGKDCITQLLKVMTQFDRKILLTYDSGSIKKISEKDIAEIFRTSL